MCDLIPNSNAQFTILKGNIGHQHFGYSLLLISRNLLACMQSFDSPVVSHLLSYFSRGIGSKHGSSAEGELVSQLPHNTSVNYLYIFV